MVATTALNGTELFVRELFLIENRIFTGHRGKDTNQNSLTTGSYLWYNNYEDTFKPHLFLIKQIKNKSGFEKDFGHGTDCIKRHELFKERLDTSVAGMEFAILVYNFSKIWEKRIKKLANNDLSWLPQNPDKHYRFVDIINRTEKGFQYFTQLLEGFGMSPHEIDVVVREAKMDDRPLWTGFQLKNETMKWDKQQEKLFREWL